MPEAEPLVRPAYAAAIAAIGRLSSCGMLTPSQAAVLRAQAFWDAERVAAELEGIDIDLQAAEHWKRIVPGADAN